MEPRHHGSNRYRQVRGNLLVGQLLDVAEQNDFLVLTRDPFERGQQVLVGEAVWDWRDERRRAGEPIGDLILARRRLLRRCCRIEISQARHFVPGV